MTFLIKICGLTTPETMEAALAAGADMVGLVRFPKSPRHVSLLDAANLAAQAKGRATRVVLLVDAPDGEIMQTVNTIRPDMLQLHGGESPARVREIKALTGLPVMKAIGIADRDDLSAIGDHVGLADRILLDAKPPRASELPGGNGLTFDWRLLAALDPALPFMLSGGLTPDNVAAAVPLIVRRERRLTGLDVSSGVESAPGVKDPERIAAFMAAARAAYRMAADDMAKAGNGTRARPA